MDFYKNNIILCGDAEFHCLLCSSTQTKIEDLDEHICSEEHKGMMKKISYLPKFELDFVVKVGNTYYCETCNIVIPTLIKTTLHLKEECHNNNKKKPLNLKPQAKRDGDRINIANKLMVSNKIWNGVIDDQCILCDAEVGSFEEHLKDVNHVIKLIQNKVSVDGDKICRKIGDIFFCFMCETPYPIALLENHFNTKEHDDNKIKNASNIINNGASTSSQTFDSDFRNNLRKKMFVFSENKNPGEILSKMPEFQKEHIEINFERSSAVCKLCKFHPEFTAKAISQHIKMHKKAECNSPGFLLHFGFSDSDLWSSDSDDSWTTESDSNTLPDGDTVYEDSDEEKENRTQNFDYVQIKAELAKFGKQHYIKMIHGGSKGHCTLCNTYISSHIKNFKQHVQGAKHVANLEAKHGKKNPPAKEYTTKSLKDYLRNIFFVKQMDDFWINRRLCVDKHSFVLLSHIETNGKYDKIKCFICNEVFAKNKDQRHCERLEHKMKLFSTKVVTSLKKEFVREIKENTFHCGFCNDVFASWELLKKHLTKFSHMERRDQQRMVADMTDDMFSMYMNDADSAETDIMWMTLMGNRLF